MINQTPQNTEGVNFAKQIFRENSCMSKLLKKKRLKWYQKMLFEDCARLTLTRVERKDLSSFLEIGSMLKNGYPNTQPWQIYIEIYNSIRNDNNYIKRNPPLLTRQ